MNFDDLELELRKLPGVRSAGFTEREDLVLVQVHTADNPTEPGLAFQATRLAARHTKSPVAVELVRWRDRDGSKVPADADDNTEFSAVDLTAEEVPVWPAAPAIALDEGRAKLLAVLSFADTDELEVHLTLGGQRTIGRAAASRGLLGAADATLDALRTFTETGVEPDWASHVGAAEAASAVVAVGLVRGESGPLYGIAIGDSPVEAAARATLDALNRVLARQLVTDDGPNLNDGGDG